MLGSFQVASSRLYRRCIISDGFLWQLVQPFGTIREQHFRMAKSYVTGRAETEYPNPGSRAL